MTTETVLSARRRSSPSSTASVPKARIPGGELKASVAMSVLRVCPSTKRSATPSRPVSSSVALTMQGLIILTAEGRAAASQ